MMLLIVMYFIVHAAFVRIKLMMMMMMIIRVSESAPHKNVHMIEYSQEVRRS